MTGSCSKPGVPFSRLCVCFIDLHPLISRTTRVHSIHQGEGGEQGDCPRALSLLCGEADLNPNERLLDFLDDVHFASKPQRVGTLHSSAQQALWTHCKIRVHVGKTHAQTWPQAGREWPKLDPEHAFGEGQRCPQISKGSRPWAH